MADVKLREAIAYAANNEEVSTQFYNGLRIPANTLLDPRHSTFWDSKQPGYKYDPEKAKKILDEAGYVDKDGDGMREDPKGNKLKINFLARTGGDIAEPLAQFYIQCWRDVGLDVGLQNGRLIESNAFYKMIKADDPGIDLFMAGWGMGSNPDPSGLYGRDAQFNFERYASETNDKYLAAIASEDAFGKDGIDNDYLVKQYKDWQDNMVKDVPAFPTFYRLGVTGINNRVNYWDLNTVSNWGWEKVGLLAETPEIAK
jgi:peptide/nickel transport system substrate-binding protein